VNELCEYQNARCNDKKKYVSLAKLTTQGDTVGFRILVYGTLVIMCRNIYNPPLSTCATEFRDKKENTLPLSAMPD